MGKIKGMHHVCVKSKDIDKSLDFYCGKLGFTCIDDEQCSFGRYAMVTLGNARVELVCDKETDGEFPIQDGVIAHFGLDVENVAEVFEQLKQAGVRFLSEELDDTDEPLGGLRAACLEGPDGEKINLYEFKKAF